MIITVINGSPRKNGATSKVLTYLYKDIERLIPDVKINYFDLSEVNPSYCIGCLNCYKMGKCINQNDKVEYIHDIITKSDGVIFGSPTYGSSVTGLFKVFTDRNPITEKVESKIQKVSKKFIYCIEEKKNPPVFSQIYNFIAINAVLKPMAFKDIEQYKGIIDRWEAQGII